MRSRKTCENSRITISELIDYSQHCACLNNAAMFCWYRNNKACASPSLAVCNGKPAVTASNASSASSPKYTPPYQGNGGLNCVEIGYCSRPTKAKTSMTVTVSGVATVITVAVGLPTPELSDLLPGQARPTPTAASAPAITEDPLQFTTIGAPTAAPTPELSDLLPPGANNRRAVPTALHDRRQNHNRWMG